MSKYRSTIIFALSIITMILSLGSFIFFLHIIDNKNKHTGALLSTLQDKNFAKANAAILNKKILAIEKTRQDINSYFVNRAEIDSFVNYLEDLGVNAGATVKVENFDTSKLKSNLLSVKITAKGSFSNVMNTVSMLENAPYQIHIANVSLNQTEIPDAIDDPTKNTSTTSTTHTWQATITFTVLMS